MCNDIVKYNASNFLAVPSLYKVLLREKSEYLKNMKFITIAGENFNLNLVNEHFSKLPNVRLVNEYGPTENSVCSTYYEFKKHPNEDILIGKPINNCKCYVLNDNLQLLPAETPGELYLSGPGISDGYLNKPDLTAQKFIDNPFGGKYKLYKTGDIVKFTSNGNLKFLGRTDDQVKIRGFRIELKEIEQNILNNPDVSDVIVIKNVDSSGKDILVAYIIGKNEELNISNIYAKLRSSLPSYMVPTIIKVDSFPLTPNGKIDQSKLPTPQITKSNHRRPDTKLEKMILEVCQEILKKEKLGTDDDLFMIGEADSLSILSISSKLFGKNLKLNTQDFYKYPTVQSLANYLSKLPEDSYIDAGNIVKPKETKIPANVSQKSLKFRYKNVLLTGSTGFLGVHILDYLLKNTNCTIYCIIRQKYISSPEKRLQKILTFYFDENYYEKYKNKIRILCGDLSEEFFSLDEKEYQKLQRKIDCIINTAANTKHYGDLSNFQKQNIDIVKNLIAFCEDSKIVLNHISTTTISGNYLVENDINYNFTENDFYIGQNYKDNAYVYSKFEAEKLILNAENYGLRANIFRLGNLMARASDGVFQRNKFENAYYTRLLALAKVGYIPENLKHQELEFTPIDETAEAIIKILTIPNLYNNIFHIFTNKTISINVLLKVLKKLNHPCKFISYEKFIKKLHLQKNEKILQYIISDLNTSNQFDYSSDIIINQNITNEFLNFVSFKWSTIDEEYLTQFFNKTDFSDDVNL